MKNSKFILVLTIIVMVAGCASTDLESTAEADKKPIQHLKVDDVSTMEEAERIFIDSTSKIREKTKLDVTELQEIHIITYTLEKSVAYLAQNLKGDRQDLAKEIAVIVEDIHLNSEDNLKEKTKMHLKNYMKLADELISGF